MKDYITVGNTRTLIVNSIAEAVDKITLATQTYETTGAIKERLRILNILGKYLPGGDYEGSEESLRIVMDLIKAIQ